MRHKIIINQKLQFFVALGLLTVLTSCGSYQYAGYNNDGIYSSNNKVEIEETEDVTTRTDSNYYKNYFAENKAEIEAINEENEVFTDIDSYTGDYVERIQDTLEQRQAYAGWGQTNENVTINYIDNSWGWNNPWLWGGGFGYGYYGWGQPWGWYGGGYGWNNHWGWYGGGYGYGGAWGYNNGWNNGYYNNYSYNRGRRGSLVYNENIGRNSRSNSSLSRRNSSLTGRNTLTSRNTALSGRNTALSGRNYSTTRLSRAAGVTRGTGSNRFSSSSSSTRATRPSTSQNSSSTRVRTTSPTRTSTGNRVNRSSSSSRSSGSARSSRSSSRSSGGSRSSGRSSRRGRG